MRSIEKALILWTIVGFLGISIRPFSTWNQCFSYQICEVGRLVITYKMSLPNLATGSERKVEKFTNCAVFWSHAGTYCLIMAIPQKKKSS